MFIAPPNNFNGTPMWNNGPMFFESPMMPLPDFDALDDSRQKPIPVPPPINQDFEMPSPVPPVVNNPLYTQGWMVAHIGQYIKGFLSFTFTVRLGIGSVVCPVVCYLNHGRTAFFDV